MEKSLRWPNKGTLIGAFNRFRSANPCSKLCSDYLGDRGFFIRYSL